MLFIDGFAGPGRYKGGEEGSPIIALRALRDHPYRSKMKAEFVFLFIEKDDERAAVLARKSRRFYPSSKAGLNVDIILAKSEQAA